MQYRKIGREQLDVSVLGFGMMRLPHIDGKPDAKQSIELLRYAVDHGVNYVDTAYNYLSGDSERITGEALLDGYREKVLLTTKCPVWLIESPEDFDRILDEQLTRLKTDQDAFRSYHVIPCTGCAYCRQPCPNNVAIPYVFAAYNGLQFHGSVKRAANDYQSASAFGNNADACIGCRQCEKICPQHIEIVDWLEKIRGELENAN